MRKRPLCMVCLTFLIVRSILLVLTSGETLVKVPASSIFSEQTDEAAVLIQGQVYKKTNTANIQILYLKNNSLIQGEKSYQESNILIYDDTFLEIPIGKTICVRGKPVPFEKARNPGNFDQKFYYAKQNIYGFVWSEEIISVTGEENWILERLDRFRQAWGLLLQNNMSEENGRVLSAMLLGEKSDMDEELREQYQKAGISHVLAISGLHISFIGLGIYKWIRKTGASYICAGIFSVLALSIYVIMIGFSVSVLRAYVMLLLKIGADMTGRVYDMATALLIAAAIVVWYQPLYLADAAFYMSYGAILGIIILLPGLEKLLPEKTWMQAGFSGLAIHIALFPILLWFYFEFPVCSLLINLVVIPLMPWVLSLGMCGSIGCFIWVPAGRVLLRGCDWILGLFQCLSEVCCQLPFSRVVFGKPNWWELVLYYAVLAGFIFLLERCKDRKKVRRFQWAGVLFVFFVIGMFTKLPNGKVQAAMLDVGQGDCIFIRGPKGDTYLVDGGSSDVEELAKYRIEPFLKSQGVGKLNYVFVSHGDADHYSGIEEMLNRQLMGVQIQNLVLPVNYKQDEALLDLARLAIQNNVKVVVIKAGQSIIEGALQIECVQPDERDVFLEGNAGSMVLEVHFRKFDMLLTGDVEEESEERLAANLSEKSYDILKVSHHGSKYSTTEAFLERVRPKMAWISAGENNSYGHPHFETINRLRTSHCEVFQTMEYGAILVETDGEFIDIFPSSI